MLSKLVLGFGAPPSRLLLEIHNRLRQGNMPLEYYYQPLVLESADLERSFGILKSENILGCHFAAPIQVSQATWLDHLGPGASGSGRINVIYKEHHKLIGEDTQLSGSLRALQGAGFHIEGSRVLLIGSGYEAQSFARSLAELGMKQLLLLHNSVDRVRAMANALKREVPGLTVMIGSLMSEDLGGLTAEVDLLINALPIEDEGNHAIMPSGWPRHLLIFDLVADQRTVIPYPQDSRYIDSSSLLLWQNAETFRLWNGQDPPLSLLKKVLSDVEDHTF